MMVMITEGNQELGAKDDDGGSMMGGNDVTRKTKGTSAGRCRALSVRDATALLARSTASGSEASVSQQIRRYLADLRQRMATRTVVLCKAVTTGNTSPDVTSSATVQPEHHYVLTSGKMDEKKTSENQQPSRSDDVGEGSRSETGSRNNVGIAPEGLDARKYSRSADDVSNFGSGPRRHLRHRHLHRHRKQIHSSPGSNRKYFGRRSRRHLDSRCSGRRLGELNVERVAAILKAFNCWDEHVTRLANQLRGHLSDATSSATSQLRCRLLLRYDDCRVNFIDKVFRTENGLAISWPRQITDVMDRDDFSAIYY